MRISQEKFCLKKDKQKNNVKKLSESISFLKPHRKPNIQDKIADSAPGSSSGTSECQWFPPPPQTG